MKEMTASLTVQAKINYGFKYNGELTEKEVIEVIKNKYNGNIWLAMKDEFIEDIDFEEVEEVLNKSETK